MANPSKQHLDAVILDAAGALFARHGFDQTSIQSIADAVGFSKAGLLHHYPTKGALYEAVLRQCRTEMGRIREKLGDTREGTERDLFAIRVLVDLALARPGLVSLLLASASGAGDDEPMAVNLGEIRFQLFRTFDDNVPAVSRTIRVMGSLAALGVLTLAALQVDDASTWRDAIIATSFDALGHHPLNSAQD